MASSTRSVAKAVANESLIREVNERIEQLVTDAENPEFLCECADPSCIQQLRLSVGEYEAVRASPVCFVVAPEHVHPELEDVLVTNDRFAVVAKTGEAAGAARSLNPRLHA